MTQLFAKLFGLDGLRPGEDGVRLGFSHALPAWIWAPIVVAAVLLAIWSYWRLEGRRSGRVVLAACRALLLVLLAVLAAGPRLVRENERTERDWVAVLLDRSGSMAIPDGGANRTREAQLEAAASSPAWAKIAESHELLWLGFDADAYELPRTAALGEAAGARTRLGASLSGAIAKLSGRPISGVVVVSDGRTSDPPEGPALRELTSQKVPVFTVPLGSEQALLDLALQSVDAPSSAFVGDFIPVTARVVARGGEAGAAPAARVTLTDPVTGETIDSRELPPDAWHDGVAEVHLAARPEEAGAARWSVRVESAGGDVLPGNNERGVEVELVDRPLRVAYFDGYPRWEYRFVKDLLVREKSVKSSVMLLATDRRYIQEGNVGLAHVPRSSGEWSEFDVIVLGDVRPDAFTPEQLEQIREVVTERGTGLLWIAGPGSTPWLWASTPLRDLLPFSPTLSDSPGAPRAYAAAATPITLRPEPAAARLGVLEMGDGAGAGWPARLSDPSTGWSVLRWSIALDRAAIKPTAEILADGVPISGAGDPSPTVVTMRFGAGRVVFVGSDELWRWRTQAAAGAPERFYLPLVRLAGRGSLARAGRPVVLEAAPATVGVETPVRISATLLDQSLVDAAPPSVGVRITRKASGGSTDEEATSIRLGSEGSGGSAASFASSWVAPGPGEYVVEATDPLLASSGAKAEFRVLSPDDEMRTPEADHALLAELAQRTGGAVVPPDRLDELDGLLPNRSIVIAGEPDVETLWDKPIVLAVLVLLLTGEWVGRRLLKLV
ncbi:MAG: hypothetical protein IPJ41_08155 [Phycisphaerales bacterium]|nr:hypothetical protein [Phycisphaerales bacterium]